DQRLANAVVREQLLRVARVFARDLIGFFEDAQSAQRDVLQVADRRPHKVQTARGSLWLSGRIVGGHGDQSSMRGSARAPAAGAKRIGRPREPRKRRGKARKRKKRVLRTQKKKNPRRKSRSREEPEWPKQRRERAPRDASCAKRFCRLPG